MSWLTRIALTALLVLGSSGQVATAQPTAIPTRRVPLPKHSSDGWAYPKLSGGLLVQYRGETIGSDRDDNLFVYDRDGKVVFSARFWFPDAARLQIVDVAASGTGDLGVLAAAYSSSGDVATIWARIPMRGGTAQVFRLSPFGGIKLTFGADNTVWILGLEVGSGGRFMAAAPHSALRHYRIDGTEIEKFLPWPEMQCGRHPVDITVGLPFLTTGGERVGAFLPGCNQWMEFARGDIVEKRQVPPPQVAPPPAEPPGAEPGHFGPGHLAGMALSETNEVYTNYLMGKTFRLDRERNVWAPVSSVKCSNIAGIDGQSLVCVGGGYLNWYTLNGPKE